MPPFFLVSEDGPNVKLEGPFAFFWQVMSSVINASIVLNHGGYEFGGEIEPGNWSGAIGMVVNQEADALLTPNTVMMELDGLVGYSTAFTDSTNNILSGIPRSYAQRGGWIFDSLDMHVQVCFFISWILMSVLYYVFNVETTLNNEYYSYTSSFGEDFLSFYGLLFTICFPKLPKSPGRRILLTSWFLSTFVLMTLLAGSMYSRLTVTDVPERIDKLEDILKHPKLRLLMGKKVVLDTHFQLSTVPVKMAIWKQVLLHDGLVDIPELFDPFTIDDIYRGKAVALANTEYVIATLASIACMTERRTFYISKYSFLSQQVALMYRLGLDPVIAEAFNTGALLIGGSGLMYKAQIATSQHAFPCLDNSYSRTHQSSLGLKELSQAFIVLGIGLLSSLISLFGEVCLPKP